MIKTRKKKKKKGTPEKFSQWHIRYFWELWSPFIYHIPPNDSFRLRSPHNHNASLRLGFFLHPNPNSGLKTLLAPRNSAILPNFASRSDRCRPSDLGGTVRWTEEEIRRPMRRTLRRRSWARPTTWWTICRRTRSCRGALETTASWCGIHPSSPSISSPSTSSTATSPASSGSSTPMYVVFFSSSSSFCLFFFGRILLVFVVCEKSDGLDDWFENAHVLIGVGCWRILLGNGSRYEISFWFSLLMECEMWSKSW